MSIYEKEKAQALEKLLTLAHAEQYQGLDDDMPDDCNDWIGSLEEDELCDIVLSVYRNGL